MKSSSRLQYCFALVLLLVFAVQAGLGLWLHTIFHQTTTEQTRQEIKGKGQHFSTPVAEVSCSCVDDFLVPFTEVIGVVFPTVFSSFVIQFNATYYWYTPDSLRLFRSLRAPPAFVS